MLGGPPTLEYASALTAARAYCDDETAALARRSDEPLSLPLPYREAKDLATPPKPKALFAPLS